MILIALDAALNSDGMVSIICNTRKWTCSTIGYEALISSASVAKATIGIDSGREAKAT